MIPERWNVIEEKSIHKLYIKKDGVENMENMASYGLLAGVCALVLLIAMLKRRAQLLLGFFVRMVLGVICILFVNDTLAAQGIALAVGINPISLLTTGTLGFSGVALLYGILACKFL